MAEIIAFCALVGTAILSYVHYQEHRERRHGEISSLRGNLLRYIYNFRGTMNSVAMHLETVRHELRYLPESDEKYEDIEKLPSALEKLNQVSDDLRELEQEIEDVDPSKSNSGSALMTLRAAEQAIRKLDMRGHEIEMLALRVLGNVRSKARR